MAARTQRPRRQESVAVPRPPSPTLFGDRGELPDLAAKLLETDKRVLVDWRDFSLNDGHKKYVLAPVSPG
jgi:hypothetical protein